MTNTAIHPGVSTDIIRLEHVCKTYEVGTEQVHAVEDVSLTFSPGTFCAVMGPSGSGKSTMLNLLGCLDRPSSGRYVIANEDISQLDDDRLSEIRLRHLGFVFQSFNLIPQLTVQENIALPLFYLGWSTEKSADHAATLAGTVGLAERLKHRPTELSGGQQQRVAIARALANDPKIILADEPTGNLDTATGEQIMELLTALNEQGKTIIMVTHEPDIALHARRRVHMLDGRIERVEDDA
ncbi:MAG: ABC transporter ATP-binding protein [Candidatus Hydrogenedentota bacterium]